MSDQGFNFNSPPRREAKKAFEPPPWEQDQFEELARRRDAEQKAAEEAGLAVLEDVGEGELTEEPSPATTSEETEAPAAAAVTPPAADRKVPGTDSDPRIETMLLELKNEEPPFGASIWKVSLGAGTVLVLVGAVLTVWGLFAVGAARKTGAVGAFGGGILVIFGLGFLGVGAWVAFRTLRQQGVL